MSSKNSKMASALRAGLGKEDAALAERLPDVQAEAVMAPQPEAPAATTKPAAAAKAPRVRAAKATVTKAEVVPPVVDVGVATTSGTKSKPAKGVKESFTMLAAEHRRLKLLRAGLAVGSRKPSRSDMLRVALGLLEASDKAEVSRLLDALPAMAAKKKGGKKR